MARNTVTGTGNTSEEAFADLVIRYGYQFGSAPETRRVECRKDDDGWTCVARGFDTSEKGDPEMEAKYGAIEVWISYTSIQDETGLPQDQIEQLEQDIDNILDNEMQHLVDDGIAETAEGTSGMFDSIEAWDMDGKPTEPDEQTVRTIHTLLQHAFEKMAAF